MTVDGEAYFREIGPGHFAGNPPARGPWSPEHCHAGPVAGLIVRAGEALAPGKMLTRLTVDLMRPVPLAEVRVEAAVIRAGRTTVLVEASVLDMGSKTCARATMLLTALAEIGPVPTAPVDVPKLDDASPAPLALPRLGEGPPSFADFVETRLPSGEQGGPGPKTVWMRVPPLLEGEETSPTQALCPLADCGNALSANVPFGALSFVNADLTLHLHREPEGEWFASRTRSDWQSSGIGLAEAVLYDTQGPVGTAQQGLILRPIPG